MSAERRVTVVLRQEDPSRPGEFSMLAFDDPQQAVSEPVQVSRRDVVYSLRFEQAGGGACKTARLVAALGLGLFYADFLARGGVS